MKAVKIADGVYRIGANITNGDLFEGMWPIPNGVSLNTYVVRGEKTAVIDLIRDWDEAPMRFREGLSSIQVDIHDIDYLVVNHLEPDHTGWIATFRELNPGVQILASVKCVPLLKAFYGLVDGVRAVKSGDVVDLGGGKKLVFEDAPNVHWPETIITFEPSSGVLFSCDAFGSFGSVGINIFDDQITSKHHELFEAETLRYYANIVASFSIFVERAIQKLAGLPVKIIAPSHGIVWRKDVKRIIDRYSRYAAYAQGPAEPEIAFVWGSMYGNTEQAVDSVLEAAAAEGVPVNLHQTPNEHISWALASAWKSTGLVIGMPTYEYKMFPPMAHVLDDLGRKKVIGKKAFRFGSYGWSGGAQKEFDEVSARLKWECLAPHEFQGAPSAADLATIAERVRELARAVKAGALKPE